MSNISPKQCRSARALLDMTEEDLASHANVGLITIRSFESEQSVPTANSLRSIRLALERAGVEFLLGNVQGPGVSASKRKKEH